MRPSLCAFVIPLSLLLACGGSSGGGGGGGGGDGADGGTGSGEPDAGGDNMGTLPEVPQNAGTAYVVHFHDATLRSYRLDGDFPAAGPVVELDNVSHNMALDRENDLLAVASDVGRSITMLSVTPPGGPEEELKAPEVVSTIEPSDRPVFVVLDPYRRRLYAVLSPETEGQLTEMKLGIYDVSDPANPEEVSGSPHTIPVTVSLDLDPVRGILFLVDLKADVLHGYDVGGDGFEPLPGDPIDLLSMYPEDNQFAFQARNLTVDPFRNRIYAARAQSALSEIIAFEYPDDIPRGGARYLDFAGMDDLVKLDDEFDVSAPPDERPNLLGSYQPAVDLETGDLFMSADAWNGNSATAMVAGFSADLSIRKNCEAFEGFGCWLRGHFEGEPGTYLRTDGAMCVDYTHRVVVGTSVNSGGEGDPGKVHFFRYEDDLSMSPWLEAEGGDLMAGGLPLSAVCH